MSDECTCSTDYCTGDCYAVRTAKSYDVADDVYPLHPDIIEAMAEAMRHVADRWRVGVLFRLGSVWIGAHWSRANRRLCINLIPFVTIWVTAPGGVMP
jgi:hypothetical protein